MHVTATRLTLSAFYDAQWESSSTAHALETLFVGVHWICTAQRARQMPNAFLELKLASQLWSELLGFQ